VRVASDPRLGERAPERVHARARGRGSSRLRPRPWASRIAAVTGPAHAKLEELVVADGPEAWRDLGFAVVDDVCRLGTVRIRLAGPGAGTGIVGWALRDLASIDLDGLPTTRADAGPPDASAPAAHPNGALALDHVVVFTPDVERTSAALRTAGLDLRRVRPPDGARAVPMAFFRAGDAVVEVVESADDGDERTGPARFWGLVAVVADIDACARSLGSRLGAIRDAVQPGQRIATVSRDAGLSVPLALITPRPPGPRPAR